MRLHRKGHDKIAAILSENYWQEETESASKTLTVLDKIRRGDYKSRSSYGPKPQKDPRLDVSAGDLSEEVLSEIPAIKKQYEEALLKWEEDRINYGREESRLVNEFENDLATECGVATNSKRGLLWNKAYERGHSGGLEEVYSAYLDMVELIK